MMTPYPALFTFTDNPHELGYVHPLPLNALVRIGAAGFGLLFLHRSVGEKMRAKHGNIPFFNETGVGDKFVKHMKRFAYDETYYRMFWEYNAMKIAQQNEPQS